MAAPDYSTRSGPPTLRDPLDAGVDGATVKNDAVDLPFKPRALHVSIAGNIKYTIGTFTHTEAFEVGWHPIRIDRLWAASLTATLTLWR